MIRFRVLQNCIDRGGMHLLGQGGSSAGLSWCPSFSWVRLHVGDGRQGPAYVYARPSERSATVGVGGEMVIATSPLHLVGGFGEILRRDGRHGWIAARALRFYESTSGLG